MSLLSVWLVAALTIPDFERPVRDDADVLSVEEEEAIEAALGAMWSTKKAAMAVWLLRSLDGEPIEDVAVRTFERWKLGEAGVDQGLLYLVAIDDRVARMEIGYGLEGTLTDAWTRRLQDDEVRPYFRAGRYGDGVKHAVLRVASTLDVAVALSAGEAPAWGSRHAGSDVLPGREWLVPLCMSLFGGTFLAALVTALLARRWPRAARVSGVLIAVCFAGTFWSAAFMIGDPVFYGVISFFTAAFGLVGLLVWRSARRPLGSSSASRARGAWSGAPPRGASSGASRSWSSGSSRSWSSSSSSSFSSGGRSGGGGSSSRW